MSRKIAILLLLVAWLPAACGRKKLNLDPKKMSDKQIYETGLAKLKKGDYAQARDALKIVYESFPQSEYRILARIEYADSYYKEGGSANYILAIQEYQDFISLFPFSPKAEYAQYMVGMCYYQMIEKPDRDQTQTRKALDEFRKVVDTYPKGQYYQKAYEYLLKCYSHLAEHEYLIARYYERTGKYQAAVDRLKAILKAYPESVHEPRFLFSLARSLQELHQFSESCTFYDQLLQKWPTSEFVGDAKENKAKVCKDINRASS